MEKKYHVPAVEKAIRILDYVARHPNATFSDIYESLSLSKSTTYQTLSTLEDSRYVRRTSDRRYQIDVGVLTLVQGILLQNDLVEVAREPLERLARETGLTVHLCAFTDPYKAVCLYKIDGINFTIRNTAVGRELIMHTSATGKVLLAWLSDEERQPYLQRIQFTKFTDTTITSLDAYLAELRLTRQRGYSVDNCEGAQGAMGIATPVLDREGHILAAVSIGAVITEIPVDEYGKMAEKLRSVSEEIASRYAISSALR